MTTKETAVSGIQVTGKLHLGNYLGAINNWLRMQDEYNCLFFLADLHAITVPQQPDLLKQSTISSCATYLACGLDPNKSIMFPQSMVSQHSELAWIFNCVTPLGWLKRMTQFKDKANNQENASLGLLSYPVLMAADILAYKADVVPVGEDQKQHLELTRDIAAYINRQFNKEIFKLPRPLIEGVATRIMSLKDGTKKMSKSDAAESSIINLIDTPDQIHEKIKKAKTDSMAYISYDVKNRPEVTNLINIYSTITNLKPQEIVEKYEGKNCSQFKENLAEVIIETLTPIQNQYKQLMHNQDYLISIFSSGAKKASSIAGDTLKEVKEFFGFL